MLPLSLSYDHRLIDGADARAPASCAGSSTRIENPLSALGALRG